MFSKREYFPAAFPGERRSASDAPSDARRPPAGSGSSTVRWRRLPASPSSRDRSPCRPSGTNRWQSAPNSPGNDDRGMFPARFALPSIGTLKPQLAEIEFFEVDRESQFGLQHFHGGRTDRQMDAAPAPAGLRAAASRKRAPLAPVIPRTTSFIALERCGMSLSRRLKPTEGRWWAFCSHVNRRDPKRQRRPGHRIEAARIHHIRQALSAGKFRHRVGQVAIGRLPVARNELSDPRQHMAKVPAIKPADRRFCGIENSSTTTRPPGAQTRAISRRPC